MTAAKTESTTPKTRTASKASASSAPGFEAFSMQKMEMPAAVREMTEKGLNQSREAYEKFKSAAEEATDMIEDSYETTRQGVVEFNMRALDAAKTNTDATYDFMKSLVGAKSLSEAIELQSSFARSQFDTMSKQAKDMQEIAGKFASDISEPMKDAFGKAVKDFKTA
ncbi:phasin [Breoghania corrubedonensis]|uniref:Phasin n=1 Tax=Breoghania corrubedonensis TaxID=665038 RepID=A0A2T5VF74_9HYPH|nr:phasin [Breoghania corrubedonensis]PTW62402.1 phasin [Breoghania corrubedonensis]